MSACSRLFPCLHFQVHWRIFQFSTGKFFPFRKRKNQITTRKHFPFFQENSPTPTGKIHSWPRTPQIVCVGGGSYVMIQLQLSFMFPCPQQCQYLPIPPIHLFLSFHIWQEGSKLFSPGLLLTFLYRFDILLGRGYYRKTEKNISFL